MKKSELTILLTLTAAIIVAFDSAPTALAEDEGAHVLGFSVTDIAGNEVDMSSYSGKVLLLVNVASRCGMTPQYANLVGLHNKYSEQGLAILGFPANNFAGQEPGTNVEIQAFCTKNYGVEFDMFSKISVKGDDIAPLYQALTSEEENGGFGGEIKWNFTKFLVNRSGRVVARFEPRTKPTDPEVIAAIERELAK
jgi:glutathione peroxidase